MSRELIDLKTELDYEDGKDVIPEGAIRIGASKISNYFTYTRQFFGELMLGEKPFTGNSSSVTGTIVHYICEQYAKYRELSQEARKQISNYILKHTDPNYTSYNNDVDINYVESQYKPMAQAIVNDYLIKNMPTHVEPFIAYEVLPDIYVGGSIDNLTLFDPKYNGDTNFENLVSTSGGIIVDYKTTGVFHTSLPKPTDPMKFGYRLQLLTYAWVLRQRGITIDRIRLVYVSKEEIGRVSERTGKPLTDYPSKISVQTEQLTEEDFSYIENIIKLVAESVQVWKDNPELRYILAQDYQLKFISS